MLVGFVFGARVLPRQRLVHGAVPRPGAVARPLDARGRAHGRVRGADHARVPVAAARAARTLGAPHRCCRCSSRGSGRCASRCSAPGRTADSRGGASGVTQSTSIARPPRVVGRHVGAVVPHRAAAARQRSNTCGCGSSARIRYALPDRRRRARCWCSCRSSRRRRPGRSASARSRATGRPATSTSARANAVLNAQLDGDRAAVRAGHGRAAVARGRHRLRSDDRRVDGRRPRRPRRPDRRAAARERRHGRGATSTSTRRCCGRQEPTTRRRRTTSGIRCRSASTCPIAGSTTCSRPTSSA